MYLRFNSLISWRARSESLKGVTQMSKSSGKKWAIRAGIAGAAALVVWKGPKIVAFVAQKTRLPQLFNQATEAFDHLVRWDKLPPALGLLELVGIRNTLREKNLYDTSSPTANQPKPADGHHLTARTADGTF